MEMEKVPPPVTGLSVSPVSGSTVHMYILSNIKVLRRLVKSLKLAKDYQLNRILR